jgi:hypothetical protein
MASPDGTTVMPVVWGSTTGLPYSMRITPTQTGTFVRASTSAASTSPALADRSETGLMTLLVRRADGRVYQRTYSDGWSAATQIS